MRPIPAAVLMLVAVALAACSNPAPAPTAAAPRASTNVQTPVALAPQAARTVTMAAVGSLRGQWDSSLPSDPSYVGVALIDAQHRVTFDGKGQHGRGQGFGYAKVDFPKVEIFLTDRAAVTRIVCTVVSPDRMECREILPDGRFTVPSIMTRVGPGPATLMPASP